MKQVKAKTQRSISIFLAPGLIAMAMGMAACAGHQSGESTASPAAASENSDGGPCSEKALEDITKVKLTCQIILNESYAEMRARNLAETENCKSLAQSFVAKYPNLNCSYVSTSSTSVEDKTTTETTAQYQHLVDQLESAGF
jgi:hypothetical protein